MLDSGSKGWGSRLGQGSLCYVLGQDTLLSQYLSPPRRNGYVYLQTVRELGATYSGLASHSEEEGQIEGVRGIRP